jgi:thiosulfate/3-mercaptopyruvate sulfurtransferase
MSQYAHPEVLVDTQWLNYRLSDPNICLIEVGMNPQVYNEGHIPGAVFWNAISDLLLPDFRINFDPAAVKKLLARSGITKDTTIVTASTDYPATGALLFWLLKVFGHDDVRVLNGGRQKWIAEGRPLTTEIPAITPTQYYVPAPNENLRAFCDDVQQAIARVDRVLVDVRTPQEYNGECFMTHPPKGDERAGHIPGAIHVPYEMTLNEDGTFKSVEELQALYQDKGITPDRQIITYCAVGGRSGYAWFVLKYLLGYSDVRNYDGSWNEWSRSNLPIET